MDTEAVSVGIILPEPEAYHLLSGAEFMNQCN